MNLLITILKALPILLPLLRGLIGGLNSLNEANKQVPAINIAKLEALVKRETIKQIQKVVNDNKGEIQAWVPTKEQAAQEKQINDLLAILQKAQDEYNATQKE